MLLDRLPLRIEDDVRSLWSSKRRNTVKVEILMSRLKIMVEFWEFLREQKKFWLIPIVVILGLLGILVVFSQSSAVAPFIYTVF